MNACTHGMPSPASCVECMEEGPVAPPKPAEYVARKLTAQFDSSCPRCHEPIEEGDRIALLEPVGLWVCESCTP